MSEPEPLIYIPVPGEDIVECHQSDCGIPRARAFANAHRVLMRYTRGHAVTVLTRSNLIPLFTAEVLNTIIFKEEALCQDHG